jgi:hypothetical protein
VSPEPNEQGIYHEPVTIAFSATTTEDFIVATSLNIYSHVAPSLQEAAARRFEEGLESAITETQVAEVLEKDVGKMS